jgi:hypothetical protein
MAEVNVNSNTNCCGYPNKEIKAEVDPTVTIDPSSPYASDFALEFSPGFGPSALPEISTWITMLLGFAGLSIAGYRTSRKAVMLS